MPKSFRHRGDEWVAFVSPVLSEEVETGLEVVFVREDGKERYAWPVEQRLLEGVAEGGVSLDRHRLRRMLRWAMKTDRRPAGARSHDDEGVLTRVRKLLE